MGSKYGDIQIWVDSVKEYCVQKRYKLFRKAQEMTTRAKFSCNSVRKYKNYNNPDFLYEAEFLVVTRGEPGGENESFFKYTPTGSIKISSIKEDQFIPGQEYYVDFTEVGAV